MRASHIFIGNMASTIRRKRNRDWSDTDAAGPGSGSAPAPDPAFPIAALGAIDPFLNDGRVRVTTTFRGRQVQVKKKVLIGSRGGLYYMNGNNKPVYLKDYQRKQCVAGSLQYDSGACAPASGGVSRSQNTAVDNTRQTIRMYGGFTAVRP